MYGYGYQTVFQQQIMGPPGSRRSADKFKMEAANEVGVDLKKGYNGSMTTREAGSIGGQMVKKMIQSYEQGMSNE